MERTPPVTKIRQDLNEELRNKRLKINSLNSEIEILERRRADYYSWKELAGEPAKEFLELMKQEIEGNLYVQMSSADDDIERKNFELSSLNENMEKRKSEKKTLEESIVFTRKKAGVYSEALVSALNKKNEIENEYNDFVKESNEIKKKLHQEIDIAQKHLDEINKSKEKDKEQIEREKEHNKKWSDHLKKKEDSLKVWTVRLARKLKDEFPNVTLKFDPFNPIDLG